MKNLAEFANRYFKYADIYLECQLNGDHKKGNRAMRNLVKMDEQFAGDEKLYKELYSLAIRESNKMAQVELCVYGVMHNYNKNRCITELQTLSSDESLGPVTCMINLLLDKYARK